MRHPVAIEFSAAAPPVAFAPVFRGKDQAIYEILKNHTEYHDLGADYLDQLQRERVKRHLVNRLEGLGYQVNLKELPGKAVA